MISAPQKVAVIDGVGEDMTVSLYLEDDGEMVQEIPWPKDWPETVSFTFLRDQGYRIEKA